MWQHIHEQDDETTRFRGLGGYEERGVSERSNWDHEDDRR